MSVSISPSPCRVTFAIFSSGLLDMLVESCFLSHCWKNFTWQMWCGSSCDWQQLPEIVAKHLVGICLGLREEQHGRFGAGKTQ